MPPSQQQMMNQYPQHPGFMAVDWLKKNPADIVTMHLGTNDIFRGDRKTAEITAALGKLIDQMRESNAAMRIIV